HDYLRLLFPSIGNVHCPKCGKPIQQQSAENIVEQLLEIPPKTKVMILAPLVRGRKGRHEEVFASVQRQGFVRVRVNGELFEIDKIPALDKNKKHTIETVIDRLVIAPDSRSRINDSVELALATGEGLLIAMVQNGDDWDDRLFSEKNACLDCSISFETLTPKHFSFNSPYGACPTCHGLGNRLTFDEELLIPDETLSLEKCIHPWRRGGRRLILYYKKLIRVLAEHYDIDLNTPFNELPASFKKVLFYGSGEENITYFMRRHKITKPFEGVIPNLQRRYTESDSEYTQKRLRAYMDRQKCTACNGARLRPESLACTIAGKNIYQLCTLSIEKAGSFFEWLGSQDPPRPSLRSGHPSRGGEVHTSVKQPSVGGAKRNAPPLEGCHSPLHSPPREGCPKGGVGSPKPLSPEKLHIARDILKEIRSRISFMMNVGLDYLTLDRESGT
ncbi:MAG: hypothetical protein KAG97_01885, partial [Victivallales bacterium]|nr:hypothetical protein [Victivallales bacterium]